MCCGDQSSHTACYTYLTKIPLPQKKGQVMIRHDVSPLPLKTFRGCSSHAPTEILRKCLFLRRNSNRPPTLWSVICKQASIGRSRRVLRFDVTSPAVGVRDMYKRRLEVDINHHFQPRSALNRTEHANFKNEDCNPTSCRIRGCASQVIP